MLLSAEVCACVCVCVVIVRVLDWCFSGGPAGPLHRLEVVMSGD